MAKSAYFYGGTDIRVVDEPVPEPGPGEALVRVMSAGVCGSDLHNYRGHRPAAFAAPWQQGHELAGVIEGLGPGVAGLRNGQRVAVEAEHLLGCGRCRVCRAGQNHICTARGVKDGSPHGSHGFSQYDTTISSNCHPISDDVSFDAAALADCYACAVHTVNRSPVSPNMTVAIIGAGAIAMTFGQVAKAYGAGRVIMAGTRRQPLDVALSAGAADETVVVSERDPVDGIREITAGEGADLVVETVGGTSQLLAQAAGMARRGGMVVVLGLFTAPQTLDASVAMRGELSLRWSNSFSSWDGVPEYMTALRLVSSRKVDPALIVTHHFPLDRVSEAFATADDKRSSGAIRVMVHP